MKKIKLGFIAFHPGSTNTLTKIIQECRRLNYEVYVYPFLEYAQKEWNEEKLYIDGLEFFNQIPKDLDILFYSAASNSIVENHIPLFCKENNITSISTVDIFWLTKDNLKTRFSVVPDVIITPEKRVKIMLEELNIHCRVENLGNPYFDISKSFKKELNNFSKSLAYISFPSSNAIMCETDDYSKKIMKELVEILKEDSSIDKLYLCLHPRESKDFVHKLMNNNEKLKDRILLNPYKNTTECCKYVDVIVGWNSTVLFEEYLRGKAVLFYENKEKLTEDLKDVNLLYEKKIEADLPENVVENYISLIHEIVKKNK